MISVIDIGTNTIRAVGLIEDIEIENLSEKSKILEYTQNGVLTEEGISDLVQKLEKLTGLLGVKPYAFATSAFRSLENKNEVCTRIYERLGIEIDVLSGEEEAECDFLSMKRILGKVNGVGADLGGGSCQMFGVGEEIGYCKSLPIGVKRLQTQFVSGIVPNKTERKNINNYLKTVINFPKTANTLYIMGGTARAILKLTRTLIGGEISKFSPAKLRSIADFAYDSTTIPVIKKVVPKRYDSIGIGMDVICLLAESIGANKIQIVDCSVREGYIIRKTQKNP